MNNNKVIRTIYGKKGYTIIKKYYTEERINEIREDLMMTPFVPEDFGPKPQPFPVYLENSNKIYVPKHYGFEKFGNPDSIKINKGIDISLDFKGSLKENQIPIAGAFLDKCKDGDLSKYSNGGLLCLPCGLGKTFLALYLISKLKKKALVIVHKEFLLNQWISEIKAFIPDARVGIIQGGKIDINNKDIVIGMLQSISMKDYSEETFESFGTTVIDECFPDDTLVTTDKGKMKIQDLFELWNNKETLPKVLSFNNDTKVFEYKNITYAWKNDFKPMINIIVNGAVYTSTLNHKYLVYESENNFIWKEASTILKDDILISYVGNHFLDYSNSKIYLSKVIDVYNSDVSGCNLYDIEVEDNHNFLISGDRDNYIETVVHNCHHINAEVFSRALPKINSWYSIGLSATPNRVDGLQKIMFMYLGPIIYKIDKRDDRKVRVNVVKFLDKDPSYYKEETTNFGKVCMPKMVTNIVNNYNRNIMINCIIKKLVDDNRQILVLSDRREHLNVIYDMVKEYTTVGYYIGGMKQKDLDKSATMRVVLGTYPMSSEGLNIPSLDAAVFTTSKSSIEQSIGRIVRKAHDRMPIAYDIVDSFSVFPRQYLKREASYKKLQYEIYETKIVSDEKTTENTFIYELDKPFKQKVFNNRKRTIVADSSSSESDEDDTEEKEITLQGMSLNNKLKVQYMINSDDDE